MVQTDNEFHFPAEQQACATTRYWAIAAPQKQRTFILQSKGESTRHLRDKSTISAGIITGFPADRLRSLQNPSFISSPDATLLFYCSRRHTLKGLARLKSSADVRIDTRLRPSVATRLAFPDRSTAVSNLRRKARSERLTVEKIFAFGASISLP